MATNTEVEEATMISPDEAFAVLGDETRLQILETLCEADEPLAFSEVFDRVDYETTANFSYHLERLESHFVRQTDEGYELRQAGRRVVETILSGIVTADPVLDPTLVDEPCPYCDDRFMVAFQQERVQQYCPGCEGHYGQALTSTERIDTTESGYFGSISLPPAGLQGRTAEEVQQAAATWGTLEYLAIASGLCPRCSAALDESVRVCETHEPTGRLCERCDNHHAVQLLTRCPNCHHEQQGAFVLGLLTNIDLLAFLIAHGINPISPASYAAYDEALMKYDEEVLSIEPFEARFTFSIDGKTLALTVDDELSVDDVTKWVPPETV